MKYNDLRHEENNWIAYMGRTGSGKTTQAYMIADALLNRDRPIRSKVYYYPELVRVLSALRFDAERYENAIKDILTPELVVFDDFLDVIPREDSFEEQTALTLIKRRYARRAPLVITTEHTPETIRRKIPRHGEAILGRILERCCGRVDVAKSDTPNYRFVRYSGGDR